MWRPGRGRSGGEVVRQRTAEEDGLVRLIETCASPDGQAAIVFALKETLAGLLPEQAQLLLISLIGTLPASARLAILSQSVPPYQIAQYLAREERRPFVVRDLVEHGRQTGQLDFSLVPAGSRLELNFYHTHGCEPILDHSAFAAPNVTYSGKLIAGSLGDGSFEVLSSFSNARTDNPTTLYSGAVFSLGRPNPTTGQLESMGLFGRTLHLARAGETESHEITRIQNLGMPDLPVQLGKAWIDEESVFFE